MEVIVGAHIVVVVVRGATSSSSGQLITAGSGTCMATKRAALIRWNDMELLHSRDRTAIQRTGGI
jgi:H+/gluconate symporter-like permease